MLVQLSPWQTVETSVPVSSKPTRRRKRSGSSGSDTENDIATVLPVVASFVSSTKRYRQNKKRKDNLGASVKKDETVPLIAVTSSGRVSVLGRPLTDSGLGGSNGNDTTMHECSQWQYVSHPDQFSTFLQESPVNGSSKPPLVKIPAILDDRNDRVYAFQKQNTVLCCWHAERAGGPDDSDAPAAKVFLRSPALSLFVLPYKFGTLCGTCSDGSLYVGQWETAANGTEILQIVYLEPLQRKDSHHVCTIMQTADGMVVSEGKKRKASMEGELVAVYQVFCGEAEISIFRRLVDLSHDGPRELLTSTIHVSLLDHTQNGQFLDAASIEPSLADGSRLALTYRIGSPGKSKQMSWRYYSALVALDRGEQIRPPFPLPKSTRQTGAVTPSLLAVGTLDQILFYDLVHGAVVHSLSLPDGLAECENWSLLTEARQGFLAILCVVKNRLHVCLAKASLADVSEQQSRPDTEYSLAVGLRSSLRAKTRDEGELVSFRYHGLRPLAGRRSGREVEEDAKAGSADPVEVSLQSLRAHLCSIQDPDNKEVRPYEFLCKYEKAVSCVLESSGAKYRTNRNGAVNPQDPTGAKKKLMQNGDSCAGEWVNGIKSPKATSQLCLNGHKPHGAVAKGYTPASLPQRFLDGAASIVLAALQLPPSEEKLVGVRVKLARLDARLILSRLLQTGKISARLHFDSRAISVINDDDDDDDKEHEDYLLSVLRSTKLSNKKGRRVFSPVDLMHDMLTYCRDVSERHMVTMIHYMLCRALPEDVAENFLDPGNLDSRHPFWILAKEFFDLRSALRKRSTSSEGALSAESATEREKKLSTKLLNAGSSFLMQRIVRYSSCNETLLRSALSNCLPMREEPAVLARVLLNLLNNAGSQALTHPIDAKRNATLTISLSKWVCALCEASQDQLLSTNADDDDKGEDASPLELVIQSITASLEQVEAVMSLGENLSRPDRSKGTSRTFVESEAKADHSQPQQNPRSGPVPPYSIERLIL